eukprot:203367-Rhodomonas_salina.9
MPGTVGAYGTPNICRRVWYAMTGTDLAYDPTRSLCPYPTFEPSFATLPGAIEDDLVPFRTLVARDEVVATPLYRARHSLCDVRY